MSDIILLDHGEGGAATDGLVRDVFLSHFGAPPVLEDAAVVEGAGRVALTTDSFVVRPLFFPGGDIGTLAISGTVNDLAMSGAVPRWLTTGFIIEEGFAMADLGRVVRSMAETAKEAGVTVVTGDTKVVGRGEADGLFINTSGMGTVPDGVDLSASSCRPGDMVLVSGPVGDHGMAVMVAREGFGLDGRLESDCQPLADLAAALLEAAPAVRVMRDPTRGGLATALIDLAKASGAGIRVRQDDIPLRREVASACELLGIDPLYVACEGRLVAVVPPDQAETALQTMRRHPRGRDAAIIGQVNDDPRGGVVLETTPGGLRPMIALRGAQLPRIC